MTTADRTNHDRYGAQKVPPSVDLEVHDRACPHRFGHSSFRYHDCPECGELVDTFGGNVA